MQPNFCLNKFEKQFLSFPKKMRKTDWLNENYYILNKDFGVFFRKQKTSEESEHIDCIPNFWLFTYKHFQGEVSYVRNGQSHKIWGHKALFIPPFSIVHWQFNSEQLNWFAFQSTAFTKILAQLQPLIFNSEFASFASPDAIIDYVLNHRHQWTAIGAMKTMSKIAEKVKTYLDCNFMKNINLSSTSYELGYNLDSMNRAFKKMYGVSPSTYLRDLKYYQAALQITESDRSLNSIAQGVGINNYENFSKNFHNVFKAPPKSFRSNI